ncbi:hypothetical protein EFA69_04335 [Rufibacter immobilis]|uniref:Uncharacterized protein n=1 Tax=Rufibacter immobilis TaxID=1348778 RepID=A0A3M9N430_9BACT|nr:hypothetical protein [Rufibacter immobilis]RNI32554.1 hypothetical protein EFA69_04335 [Rufibacter immobilis]
MKQTLRFLPMLVGLALVLLTVEPVAAQTEFVSRKQHKREVRNSIKAAKKVETDFNESHLNISAYNLRDGESGRKLKKQKKKNAMPISEDGTAVTKPKLFPKRNVQAKAKKK